MALKDRTKKTTEEQKTDDIVYTVNVLRARQVKNDFVFDMDVNGVSVCGCWIKTSKDGETFTSFPSYKGSDGKYYSHAYFKIPADVQKDIEDQIEKYLDEHKK